MPGSLPAGEPVPADGALNNVSVAPICSARSCIPCMPQWPGRRVRTSVAGPDYENPNTELLNYGP